MRQIAIRDLIRQAWQGDRVFFHNLWFATHNNRRMAALLPRLGFVDALLVHLPARRVPRGIAFRVLHRTRGLRYRWILGLAGRRYLVLFTNGAEQSRFFAGQVVVDMDDPVFSEEELACLARPNVRRVVVTGDDARERYRELGLEKEILVIPQGVELRGFSDAGRRAAAERLRRPGEVVVGFHAAWLLSSRDPGGSDPLYNVEGLLEMWEEIRARVPRATLWLIGRLGPDLTRLLAGRDDIRLLGYVEQTDLANVLACLDVGVYPRRVSHVRRAVKVGVAGARGSGRGLRPPRPGRCPPFWGRHPRPR